MSLPCRRTVPCPRAATDEQADDEVVRDGEQPPLDEHEAAGEVLGVGDVEPRRVVRLRAEAERRVAVGAEATVAAVVGHAPRPAEHAEVEVEEPAGVAAGEEDREERDDADHGEGDPQEPEREEVRDGEEPLDEPEPPRERLVEAGVEGDGADRTGVTRVGGLLLLRESRCGDRRRGAGLRRVGGGRAAAGRAVAAARTPDDEGDGDPGHGETDEEERRRRGA